MKTLEGELVYSQKDSRTFVFHIMSLLLMSSFGAVSTSKITVQP